MRGRSPSRVFAIGVALLWLVPGTEFVRTDPQTNSQWITEAEQTRLVEGLRQHLPGGWTLTPIGPGGVPDQWQSVDTRSFEVDGKNGARSFRIWFLPIDWIGIRRPDPNRPFQVYWEGVLMDSKYKSITLADERPIHEAVQAMGMNTPSLINSGWWSGMLLFRDRLTDIDQQTQDLVRRFCTTRACVDEAAYSLIVLGVPAKTVTLDCVEHAVGRAQESCASALGYWGGADSLRVLNAVVQELATSPRTRGYAAASLGRIADPSSGPALRQALEMTPAGQRDTAGFIVAAIGRVRFRPAAPDILARLPEVPNRFDQIRYFKTLADLRYTPAVPALTKLCETTDITSEWIAKRMNEFLDGFPEVALLRITEPWGQPADGIRLRLLPPGNALVPGPILVTALIENVGDSNLPRIQMASGLWTVDGHEYPNIDRPRFDGLLALDLNSVVARPADLSGVRLTPGSHTVLFRLLGAVSNPLTLRVGPGLWPPVTSRRRP